MGPDTENPPPESPLSPERQSQSSRAPRPMLEASSRTRNSAEDAEVAGLRAQEPDRGTETPSPEVEKLRAQLKTISDEREALHRRVSELSRTVSRLQHERDMNEALLETRATELREAQAFLSKVDDVPDSDVVSIVNRLNSVIFQTAASIADTFRTRISVERGSDAVRKAQKSLSLTRSVEVGKDLLDSLDAFDHREDTIVVQTAVQATMVSCVSELCTTWKVGASGSDVVLGGIYLQIRDNEPQTVAGRWRALSHAYNKSFLSEETEHQACFWEKRLTNLIEKILVASGVDLAAAGGKGQRVAPVQAIHEIIELALRFQTVTSEHIVSRELSAVLVKSGEVFDPVHMVDQWEDAKRARTERHVPGRSVLCTTKLGLQREVKNLAVGQGVQGTLETTMLIKPTVVLTSMLDELRREHRALLR